MVREKSLQLDHTMCLLGRNIWLHFRRDASTSTVQMFVEIQESTTREDVISHWGEIRTWRDLLNSWQGPSSIAAERHLLYQLHEQQKGGRKYSAIANSLNQTVVHHLREYVQYERATQRAIQLGKIITTWDLMEWQSKSPHNPFRLQHAQDLLRMMGLNESDVQEWCNHIMNNIQEGKPALLPKQGPVTRDHVIGRLKTFRAQHRQWLSPGGDESPP